ncbi:MAG: hypothetical protein II823_00385 [Kiritimatiellae bacterium]|nr:hypothetical protein [Kiritimatiellia bacterium]
MPSKLLPDWETLLSSAARLQSILPEAVLVGGTAAATYAHHRTSVDHDHTLTDLREHFDDILATLESVAGWKTARVRRPVLILGSLDGIETGIRQLIREEPLETAEIDVGGVMLKVPTKEEMLRIKAVLVLKRNATRDYLDLAAMSRVLGDAGVKSALLRFDELYPQSNGASALQQLANQLANPLPFDLDETDLREYKNLERDLQNWDFVTSICRHLAVDVIHAML